MNGEPVVCVATLSDVNQNPCVNVGVNFTKDHIGDTDDPCFFENNFCEDKISPSGINCAFKVKIVPCFVGWSEKGGITSVILTDVLREID